MVVMGDWCDRGMLNCWWERNSLLALRVIGTGTESTEGRKDRKGMGERTLLHDGGVGLPTLNRLWNSHKYGAPEGPAVDTISSFGE